MAKLWRAARWKTLLLACSALFLVACEGQGFITPTPVPEATPAPGAPTSTPLPPDTTPTPLPRDSSGVGWKFVGLAGQSIRTVGGVGRPEAPVFAGGPAGLYRTTDHGASWQPLPLPGRAAVDEIQVSRVRPQVMYAGKGTPCGEDEASTGQFGSTDSGATWHPLGEAPTSIQIDAQDPLLLTAMSCRGMVRSSDGGAHWRLAPDAAMIAAGLVGARVRVPANPIGPIYASWLTADGSGRIRTSYDGGANWGGADITHQGLTDLLVDDKRPQYAWALSKDGVVRTTDNGERWVTTVTGLDPAHFIRAGAMGPYQLAALAAQYTNNGDMDELYLGTYATANTPAAGAFSSGDIGKVWTRFGGKLGGRDIRSIHVARETPADHSADIVLLYAGTDNGVYKVTLGTAR
ncbi:MAG TPA: hypothetical protein VM536_09145 [Chloroflexia bacterium]|nr:hypothetical protein [Chloroflexia bacterium]